MPFLPTVHPAKNKVVTQDGSIKCEDIFQPMIKMGTEMIPRKTTWSNRYTAPSALDSSVVVEVYKTDHDPPPLTTDACTKVAELKLGLTSMYRRTKPVIEVILAFGDTRITVTAKEKGSGNPVYATFDCLR